MTARSQSRQLPTGGSERREQTGFADVYSALRVIASRERHRNPSTTLNTTVLVHEAWLRFAGVGKNWVNDGHYLAAAALAMRHILVDYARRRGAAKRTPDAGSLLFENREMGGKTVEEVLAIDKALAALERQDVHLARLVELRFFVGLPLDEVAEYLGISARTAARDWKKARAFLLADLS